MNPEAEIVARRLERMGSRLGAAQVRHNAALLDHAASPSPSESNPVADTPRRALSALATRRGS